MVAQSPFMIELEARRRREAAEKAAALLPPPTDAQVARVASLLLMASEKNRAVPS